MQNTRGCLIELQRLASGEGESDREGILDRVTDLFFLTSQSHGDTEQAVFGDVIERIAYQLESSARARLAERLAETEKAPHQLVFKLATDEIGIARPIDDIRRADHHDDQDDNGADSWEQQQITT